MQYMGDTVARVESLKKHEDEHVDAGRLTLNVYKWKSNPLGVFLVHCWTTSSAQGLDWNVRAEHIQITSNNNIETLENIH